MVFLDTITFSQLITKTRIFRNKNNWNLNKTILLTGDFKNKTNNYHLKTEKMRIKKNKILINRIINKKYN